MDNQSLSRQRSQILLREQRLSSDEGAFYTNLPTPPHQRLRRYERQWVGDHEELLLRYWEEVCTAVSIVVGRWNSETFSTSRPPTFERVPPPSRVKVQVGLPEHCVLEVGRVLESFNARFDDTALCDHPLPSSRGHFRPIRDTVSSLWRIEIYGIPPLPDISDEPTRLLLEIISSRLIGSSPLGRRRMSSMLTPTNASEPGSPPPFRLPESTVVQDAKRKENVALKYWKALMTEIGVKASVTWSSLHLRYDEASSPSFNKVYVLQLGAINKTRDQDHIEAVMAYVGGSLEVTIDGKERDVEFNLTEGSSESNNPCEIDIEMGDCPELARSASLTLRVKIYGSIKKPKKDESQKVTATVRALRRVYCRLAARKGELALRNVNAWGS